MTLTPSRLRRSFLVTSLSGSSRRAGTARATTSSWLGAAGPGRVSGEGGGAAAVPEGVGVPNASASLRNLRGVCTLNRGSPVSGGGDSAYPEADLTLYPTGSTPAGGASEGGADPVAYASLPLEDGGAACSSAISTQNLARPLPPHQGTPALLAFPPLAPYIRGYDRPRPHARNPSRSPIPHERLGLRGENRRMAHAGPQGCRRRSVAVDLPETRARNVKAQRSTIT
jgi:hypothetical protein